MPSGGHNQPGARAASEVWEEYHALGLTKRELAARLGMNREAVDKALVRHAVRHGLPRVPEDPWTPPVNVHHTGQRRDDKGRFERPSPP